MDVKTLNLIKEQCERIEKEPGFGKVLISIENGSVRIIQPTPTLLIKALDICHKK